MVDKETQASKARGAGRSSAQGRLEGKLCMDGWPCLRKAIALFVNPTTLPNASKPLRVVGFVVATKGGLTYPQVIGAALVLFLIFYSIFFF